MTPVELVLSKLPETKVIVAGTGLAKADLMPARDGPHIKNAPAGRPGRGTKRTPQIYHPADDAVEPAQKSHGIIPLELLESGALQPIMSKPAALAVLMAYLAHANARTRQAWIGEDRLSAMLGLSFDGIRKARRA